MKMKLHHVRIDYKTLKNIEMYFKNGLTVISAAGEETRTELSEIFNFLMKNKGKKIEEVENFAQIEIFDEKNNPVSEIPDEFEFYCESTYPQEKQFEKDIKKQSENLQVFVLTHNSQIVASADYLIGIAFDTKENKLYATGVNLK